MKIKIAEKKMKSAAETCNAKTLDKATFQKLAKELRAIASEVRSSMDLVVYGKKGVRPEKGDDPIYINPDFTKISRCEGSGGDGGAGGGNNDSQCQAKGDDIASACVTAHSIKNGCGYWNQFGESAKDQANAEMQNCMDKASMVVINCKFSKLMCPGEDLSGFGSKQDEEIIEEAVKSCARSGINSPGGNAGQKQTSSGN